MAYGKEVILDLHSCDPARFTKESIEQFMIKLCEKIDMIRMDLHWWEDSHSEEPHLRGISACQFIQTSNIVIHTIEKMRHVYLNIFSCKDFDENEARIFAVDWFQGTAVQAECIDRI